MSAAQIVAVVVGACLLGCLVGLWLIPSPPPPIQPSELEKPPMPEPNPEPLEEPQTGPCRHIWSKPEPCYSLTDDGEFLADLTYTIRFCLSCTHHRIEETGPATPTPEETR